MLPGPTFVKTFLRTYAELLGLDPHVLVEEYRADYEPRDELELQPLGRRTAVAARSATGAARGRGPGWSPCSCWWRRGPWWSSGLSGETTARAARTRPPRRHPSGRHAAEEGNRRRHGGGRAGRPRPPTYLCVDRGRARGRVRGDDRDPRRLSAGKRAAVEHRQDATSSSGRTASECDRARPRPSATSSRPSCTREPLPIGERPWP